MEYIDVLDENENKTGEVKSRSEVHSKGLWHRTVHIFVINDKNELLLQKRSPEKETNPGKWTTSASGHLSAGDESRAGAVRELFEEIGVKAREEELEYLFTSKEEFVYKEIINREIVDVYLIKRNWNIEDFKMQVEEVSAVKWLDVEDFSKAIEDCDSNNIVAHIEMYKKLVDILRNRS